jgi:hypothetical protein
MSRTVETTQMMRMLSVGRASYMFVDREDWEFFRDKEKPASHCCGWTSLTCRAAKRHIVCSRDVPQDTMNKLNQAIAATGGMNNPGHSKPVK